MKASSASTSGNSIPDSIGRLVNFAKPIVESGRKLSALDIEVECTKFIVPAPCNPLLESMILFSYFAPVP